MGEPGPKWSRNLAGALRNLGWQVEPGSLATLDAYIKANLAAEMKKHRGSKRLRKKKAKRVLRMQWGFMQMGRLLSRRVNYAEIGRRLFTVEPMPDPVKQGGHLPPVAGKEGEEAP